MQIYLPPTDKDQLLLELQKPARTAKALQALFDDRCLSYIKKEAMMEVLKDLVKTNKAITKAHNKSLPQDADGKPFNLLQMIIRCALQPCGVMQYHRLCFAVVVTYYLRDTHQSIQEYSQSPSAVLCFWDQCQDLRNPASKSQLQVTASMSYIVA